MTRLSDPHIGWMNDPAYRKEFAALEGEIVLAAALIRSRPKVRLTQQKLAERSLFLLSSSDGI